MTEKTKKSWTRLFLDLVSAATTNELARVEKQEPIRPNLSDTQICTIVRKKKDPDPAAHNR